MFHLPSAQKQTIFTTHITALISQSSWTISSKPLTNQMKVSSQTGREKIKQVEEKRYKSWLDNIKWHFISCWVQFKKKKRQNQTTHDTTSLQEGFPHISVVAVAVQSSMGQTTVTSLVVCSASYLAWCSQTPAGRCMGTFSNPVLLIFFPPLFSWVLLFLFFSVETKELWLRLGSFAH